MQVRLSTALPFRNDKKPVILPKKQLPDTLEPPRFSGRERKLPALVLAATFLPMLSGCSDPAQEKMDALDRFQPATKQLPVLKEVITSHDAWSYTRIDALKQLSNLNLPAEEKIPVFLQAMAHGRSMSDGQLQQVVAAKQGLLAIIRESRSEALNNQIFKVLALYPEVYYGSKHSVDTEDFSPEYREAEAKLLEMLRPQAQTSAK